MAWLGKSILGALCVWVIFVVPVQANPLVTSEREEQSIQQRQDWEFKQLFYEARSLHKQGYIERAHDLYKKAYDVDLGRIDVLPYWGLACAQLGDYEQALDAFDTYLASEPEEYLVGLNRSVCLANLGRWSESLQSLEIWPLECWQDDFRYYLLEGVCLGRLGRIDDSLHHLRKAYDLNHENVEVVLWYASTLRSKGDLRGSKEILCSALRLKDDGLLKDNLAHILFVEGELAESVSYFSQAYDLGVKRSQLNEAIVEVNFLQSEDLLLKIAEISDNFLDNPLADYLYAVCLYRQGYYTDSEKILGQILEQLPSYKIASVLNDVSGNLNEDDIKLLKICTQKYLALSLYKNKNYHKATEVLADICVQNSTDPWAHYNYSLALWQDGQNEEAVQEAEKAYQLSSIEDNDREPIYYHLAMMYENNNQFRQAVSTYKLWLDGYPNDEKVPLVKRHLKTICNP